MHDMLMIRFLATILVAGNLFLGYTHWESHRLYEVQMARYEAQTQELNQCNSEYQKLVDYHKTQGVSNPFIECVSYPERDLCFEQTMTGCLGDIDPDKEGYRRQLTLCEFMSIAARKLEYEKNYGVPALTYDPPDYFTRCAASKDYDRCVKDAAVQCMPDNSADKNSLGYRKAYDRCNRQFHNSHKDREVFLDIVELIQEDVDNMMKKGDRK